MKRILLVEDDAGVRPLVEHILFAEGYHVTSAETVAGALAFVGSQPFDLVITDVNLPDGNGLKVADAAKEAGARELVITAYGLSIQPGSLAPYHYLLKPVRPTELLAAIKRRLAEGEDGAGKDAVEVPKGRR